MDATRRARIESFIQQELSQVLGRDVRDPRVSMVTLTRVELASDASFAKIYFSVLSADTEETDAVNKQIEDTQRGLESASGFLRRQLSKTLSLRQSPELRFLPDKGIHNSIRVFQLLKEIQPATSTSPSNAPTQ